MKYSILSLLFFCMLMMFSCDKETYDFEKPGVEIELREGNLMDKKECFELVYPLEIILPDQSIVTVINEDDFYAQLKEWYKLNPDSKERPGLNYPVQVTFEGDKSKIIKSEEQMMRLKKFCADKSKIRRKVCFKLIYPVAYVMPDGSEISGDNESDIRSQIKEWYESNPDTDVKPSLSYPVNVKVIGGDMITINSEDEMIALKKRCNMRDEFDCFKMDYPITFTMPDGSEISVENDDEMNTSIKNWYEENPNEDEKPSLNYPVDVIFKDGKKWTINSEDEMIKLKKRCENK